MTCSIVLPHQLVQLIVIGLQLYTVQRGTIATEDLSAGEPRGSEPPAAPFQNGSLLCGHVSQNFSSRDPPEVLGSPEDGALRRPPSCLPCASTEGWSPCSRPSPVWQLFQLLCGSWDGHLAWGSHRLGKSLGGTAWALGLPGHVPQRLSRACSGNMPRLCRAAVENLGASPSFLTSRAVTGSCAGRDVTNIHGNCRSLSSQVSGHAFSSWSHLARLHVLH